VIPPPHIGSVTVVTTGMHDVIGGHRDEELYEVDELGKDDELVEIVIDEELDEIVTEDELEDVYMDGLLVVDDLLDETCVLLETLGLDVSELEVHGGSELFGAEE
jgi:ribosome assembly protein YihI (activator of Der GTPase)